MPLRKYNMTFKFFNEGIYMKSFFKQREQGVGLIEVMVTVLILGTSLLAIAALQSRSLMQNHGAFLATKANIVAYDLIDQVRAASSGPTATPATIAWPSAAAVTAAIQATLPTGTGTLVCVAATRICTITINWSENTGHSTNTTATQFIYTASL
jgi:type IV pilus assembly protein PilV